MKKILIYIATLALICITGCTSQSAVTVAATTTTEVVTTLTLDKEDSISDWDNATATKINLTGASAAVEGAGAAVKGGVVTISEAGTYVVSGTLTNGQIIVGTTNKDLVHLVLNGVDITNKTGAAIYAPQCDKLVLTLADRTKNTVTDGGSAYVYVLEDDKEPNAAVFVKDDLTINGTGALSVNAGFNNGIGTKDDLLIVSGNLTINAENHGMRGNDSVGIVDGILNITAGSDGIQTNNDQDGGQGWIIIQDGSLNIKAQNDGIQADTSLSISGGDFQIVTGAGSANVSAQVQAFRGRDWQSQVTLTSSEDTVSIKGLKAGKTINILGGDFTIDAEDDGLHSNGDVLISSGKLAIQSGDDGIHADEAVVISGGTINIPVSFEGIEGLSVTISDGDFVIIASDDGINAAGGASNGLDTEMEAPQDGETDMQPSEKPDMQPSEKPDMQPSERRDPAPDGQGAQGEQTGGGMGGPMRTEGAFIRITGGTIDIHAGNDGLDSNNHIYLDGGIAKISGPSMNMEGAVDMDGSFTIRGGELMAAGSVMTPAQDSTQSVILVSYTSQQASGSVIAVKDSRGKTLLEYTTKTAFTASGFTSPSFKEGETYSLFINGTKRTDITLNSLITSIGDDGGAYSMGGRPGGMGGRMAAPDGQMGNNNRQQRGGPVQPE